MRLVLAMLAACGSTPREVPQNRATAARPDPCDMVEAMLAIDNEGFQRLYDSCADPEGRPRIVEVAAPPSLIPPGLRCEGRKFIMLAQHPQADFLIVKLTLQADGPAWNFSARPVQPVPAAVEGDDDAFEVTESYCIAAGGYIEWRDGRWRTWEDFSRATRKR